MLWRNRRGRLARLVLGTALVGCGSRDAADSWVPLAGRDCDVGVPAVLTDSGVGALRIDAAVAQLALACDILDDTTMERGREGMPERRLTAILGSIATASTIANDRVWRIEIDSPRFRTRDSLGVGTTVGALRRRGARIVAGGIASYAVVDEHCGLSFQLPAGPGGASSIPDSVRVTRVLVTGC